MLELAVELATLIEKWQYSKEKCKSLLYYIAQAGNTIDGEGFIRTLAEKAPTYREDFMTIAEQLEAKGEKRGEARGYQLGRQDGINEGLGKGRQEAKHQLAKQLLLDGIERENVKRYTSLSDNELDKL